MTTESLRWFKSSYSDHGGQCVEVATSAAGSCRVIAIRDSKNTEGPALAFPADSFGAFVAGVKAGEFGTV